MQASDRYELVLGSDTARGGMYLELWERSSRRLALWAFYTDADGSLSFEKYLGDVPADVETWFQGQARKRLPPLT